MTLYLCTAGTSISTGRGAVGETLAARIAAKIDAARARHPDDLRAFLIDVCAETNGLARSDCGAKDEVLLLASDTDEGVQCGEAVAAQIRDCLGARAAVARIPGLVVDAERTFRRQGVGNLINRARAEVRAHGGDVAFNATGGFKGVVPYLTLLGMFEGVEVHYVFDGSDELIRLPPLPVRFDHQRIAFAGPALMVLGAKGVMPESEFAALPPGKGFHRDPVIAQFVETSEGLCALSAAGAIAVAEIARVQSRNRGRLFVRHATRNSALYRNDLVQRKLPDLVDPVRRTIPLNRATMAASTDLLICKPLGPSAPRIYYRLDGDDVYVVDVVPHDEHEYVIQPGVRTIWWRDYADHRFDEIDLKESADDAIGEALAEFIETEARDRDAAEARAKAAEDQEREARKALQRREARDARAALPYAAAAWAAAAFAGRTRKDAAGTPYINHLVEVVATLAIAGVDDPVTLAAAWLHDAIEDVGATVEDLAGRFGGDVAALVVELSDDKILPKDERKRLQIANATKKSDAARLIALADKIANLRDLDSSPPADWDKMRCAGYFDWAGRVIAAMGEPRSATERRLREAFEEALARRLAS
ncbi:MAG: HD domain-containing protein [Roseiarcus sp.]|jgi:putative CRISPR-associated protein (TIGR02619 family)